MILELLVKDPAATEPLLRINVFECVSDPLNPNAGGYEIDVFTAMNDAIGKLPKLAEPPASDAGHVSLDLIWRAGADVFEMMERQAGKQKNILLPVIEDDQANRPAFRGIPIEIIDG